MDRKKFLQNFSRRLNELISQEGFDSNRSKNGVDITKLSKVAGCSYQMARKYSLGLALPELHVVMKIASWLKTSPSWLLFGENATSFSSEKSGAMIEITPSLLKYILEKCHPLFELSNSSDDIINFIVDAAYDATHIRSDTETTYKIIDMMVSSAIRLNRKENKKGVKSA